MARLRYVPAGGAYRIRTGDTCLEGRCVTTDTNAPYCRPRDRAAFYPPIRPIYRNPDVYHLIRHLCPLILVKTFAGGFCGSTPQGSGTGKRYLIAIATSTPFIHYLEQTGLEPVSFRKLSDAPPTELLSRIAAGLPIPGGWAFPHGQRR